MEQETKKNKKTDHRWLEEEITNTTTKKKRQQNIYAVGLTSVTSARYALHVIKILAKFQKRTAISQSAVNTDQFHAIIDTERKIKLLILTAQQMYIFCI